VNRQNAPAPAILPRESLADSVHRVILARLLSGEINLGSNIKIDGIARELGVSQTPVREALARITENGLVERIPHVGYRAALPFTEKQLHDTLVARLTIEPVLAELAASRVTPQALEALHRHQAQLAGRANSTMQPPSVDSLQGSRGFHEIIASLADNEPLKSAYHLIHGQAQ
jgi:DNA-binding GntR family transcriptional regulator